MRSLRKLCQSLTALESQVKVLQRREPFYDAAAIDRELEMLFAEIAHTKRRGTQITECTLTDGVETAAGPPDDIVCAFD